MNAIQKQAGKRHEVNLFTFLEKAFLLDFWTQRQIVCWQGSEYPVLYCFYILDRLKKIGLPVECVDIETQSVSEIMAKLEMSFLGMRIYYWLRNLSILPAKDRKTLLTYLEQYQGPNAVFFFIDQDTVVKPANSWFFITLEKGITQQQFIQLFAVENASAVRRNASLISALFVHQPTISLDNAYILMRYFSLIGPQDTVLMSEWLNDLMAPEQSLFTLATHFFARDKKKFFMLWQRMHSTYAEAFWMTFWSEQLWRAANYNELMDRKEVVEAKKISFRLPFSFMQRDWKKSSRQELINAHDFICALDYGFKNGGLSWIELFYTKFFEGKFR